MLLLHGADQRRDCHGMLLSKNAIAEYIMTIGPDAIFCAGSTAKTATRLFSSHAAQKRQVTLALFWRGMIEYAGKGHASRCATRRDESDEVMADQMDPAPTN